MKTIYLLLIVLLVSACNNDDPVDQESLLPPVTMTGENTFGCLIDGKYFRPRDGRSTINSDNKGIRMIGGGFQSIEINSRDFKSERTVSLLIHIEDIYSNGLGVYEIHRSNGLSGLDGNRNSYINCRVWRGDNLGYQNYISFPNSGQIYLSRLDRNPGNYFIHSGTFKTALINITNPNDTIRIEQGRFDLDTITVEQAKFD